MLDDPNDHSPGQTPKWYGIHLEKNEIIIEEFQASFFVETIYWWVAIFFTLGLAVPFFLILRWARKRHRWALTNQRLMARLGIFNRVSPVIEYKDVLDTKVERPFFASVLGNGKVRIESRSGGSGPELTIWRQHDPDSVRNSLNDAKKPPPTFKKKEPSVEDQVFRALLRARGIESPRRMSEEFSMALEQHLQDSPELEDDSN